MIDRPLREFLYIVFAAAVVLGSGASRAWAAGTLTSNGSLVGHASQDQPDRCNRGRRLDPDHRIPWRHLQLEWVALDSARGEPDRAGGRYFCARYSTNHQFHAFSVIGHLHQRHEWQSDQADEPQARGLGRSAGRDTGERMERLAVLAHRSRPLRQRRSRAIIVGSPGSNAGGIGPYGLVDNCWFESTGGAYRGLYLYSATTPEAGRRLIALERTGRLSSKTVSSTVPDTVPGIPAIDSAYGGVRWVLRHSTLNNWLAVLHGSDSAPTSTLQFEFNHNTVRVSQAVDYALYIRGGTGVATGNNIGITGSPDNAGYNSAFKMVRDGPCGSGYPCFQQVGRGVVNGAEGSVPAYFWNNTYTPEMRPMAHCGPVNQRIFSSTGILLTAKPGYTELAYLIRCATSRQPFRLPPPT